MAQNLEVLDSKIKEGASKTGPYMTGSCPTLSIWTT